MCMCLLYVFFSLNDLFFYFFQHLNLRSFFGLEYNVTMSSMQTAAADNITSNKRRVKMFQGQAPRL